MTSDLSMHRDLAWALKRQATRAGEQTPRVRGADWRLAVVTAVGTGTVTADGVVCRCHELYSLPAVGDTAIISQNSSGNWIAFGRMSTAPSTWTNLTLASGYTNPGHGYTASWMREGRRIWLRGRLGPTSGTIANGAVMATIPVALRPTGGVDVGWAVSRHAPTGTLGVCRVDIAADGTLKLFESVAAPAWIGLDGITYLTN